jgi:hypothetical protein
VTTITSARNAGPTMPEAARNPATLTTAPTAVRSTISPRGIGDDRSAPGNREGPGADASTADTDGSGDGDGVDGTAALLAGLESPREIPPVITL